VKDFYARSEVYSESINPYLAHIFLIGILDTIPSIIFAGSHDAFNQLLTVSLLQALLYREERQL
jgi:hypothetical protein